MGITGVCNLNETYFKKKTKYIDLATKIKYRMGLKVAAVVMGATGIYQVPKKVFADFYEEN